MYCALPPSLQSMMELTKSVSGDDAFVFRALTDFLKALSALGVSPHILASVRRHLQLASCVREDADEGALSLEAILRQHDRLLGPQMGGFANLFRSAVDDELVFADEFIDFDGLDASTKAVLNPVGQVAKELTALEDISVVLSGPIDRVAACIVFGGFAQKFSDTLVGKWMDAREHLESTHRLYSYKAHLGHLSVQFVQHELQDDDVRDFALWMLSRVLAGTKAPEPFARRLIDTLLKKAELPSLATFERANILSTR